MKEIVERTGVRRLAPPSPWVKEVAAVACVLALVLALTSTMTGPAPLLPAVVGGAFLFLMLISGNGSWIVHAALVVMFMTATPSIPRGIRVAGVLIYYYEFLVLGSLLYAVALAYKNRAALAPLTRSVSTRIALAFSLVVLFGICLAVARGYPYWDIQYDARAVIEMVMVIFTAFVISALDDWNRYVKTVVSILATSALLMVYASVTGFELWGRTETAELYASGGRVLAGGSTAVRYLTQTTPLALAALLGCIALMLFGKFRLGRLMLFLVPSLIISILSFSRNTLLALAGTIAFAVLVALLNGHSVRLVFRVAAVPFIALVIFFGLAGVGAAVGANDWLGRQATGYANRVLAGFDETNERADNSAGYRETESDSIRKVAAEHPVFGGGFGTHYQAPSGKRGTYSAYEGTMYSHNAYNWLYLKVGAVGLATFVALLLVCVIPTLIAKETSPLLFTSAAALVGLSVAIFVTPMPIEQSGSALLGTVIGLCIAGNACREQGLRHGVEIGIFPSSAEVVEQQGAETRQPIEF